METIPDCRAMSDAELVANLKRLRHQEKDVLALIVAHLAEVERRLLHAEYAYPNLFQFCVSELSYSEAEASWRVCAVRTAAKFPASLSLMAEGDLALTSIVTLGPHLTESNHLQVLERAKGKSKLEVQRIAAELSPAPDGKDVVRHSPRPKSQDAIRPTAPERLRFSFSASEALLKLLRRAQDVMRHKYPAGGLEQIFEDALEALLDKKDPERRLRAKEERQAAGHEREPRPMSIWAFAARSVPQSVRDAVWRRDGGQCVYLREDGSRCEERGGLEFDHIVPFALGGPSNNPKNIRLLCKAHNLMLARRVFGNEATAPRTWTPPSC